MAIRFKYDATSVSIPQNASNRKYGQALVLQQKRFDQDQQQMMQQQAYDQQRMAQQQAFIANRDAQNAVNRQQLGQRQGIANLNAGFGANVAQVAPAVQQMPVAQQPIGNAALGMDVRQQALARLSRAQNDAGIINPQSMVPGQQALAGLNVSQRFGAAPDIGYPTSQSLMERQQSAEMEQLMAAQMQAQERANFEEARKAGEYDPITAAEIQRTYSDATKTDLSKELDAAQKAEWHAENNAKRRKLLENRNPNPSPEELANRNLQYYVPSMKSYVPREQADSLGPDVEVQVYEGGKLKPGVTSKAQVKETPSLPPVYEDYMAVNLDKHEKKLEAEMEKMRTIAEDNGTPITDQNKLRADAYANIKSGYDFNLRQIEAAKQQSQPTTPPPAPVAPPTGMQNLEPSYNADGTTGGQVQPPPMADFTDPQGTRWKVGPNGKRWVVDENLPDGYTVTTPDGVINKKENGKWFVVPPSQAAIPQAVSSGPMQAEQSPAMPPAQAAIQTPPVDMIGEVNQTFESGTPEQKVAMREKFSDSKTASELAAQAAFGSEDARKAVSFLKSSLSPSELVAGAIRQSKSKLSSGTDAVSKLQQAKTAGKLTDEAYTAGIIANSGKTAKQNYEMFSSNAPGKYGTGSNEGTQVVRQAAALNSLWDEMGMYDSRLYVRAFQKEPTIDDVITHVAMKGNMPRKDAEEYVYNEILSRGYSKEVQQDFEGKLTKNRPEDREKKQDEKRDSWKPKTK